PRVEDPRRRAAQARELVGDEGLERRGEMHPAPAEDEGRPGAARGVFRAHRRRGASRRWCDGRMPSSSRYLATVRRAITRPRPLSTCATSWSDSGLAGSSLASRSWIIFLTDTDETISPSPEAMPLWKKYFSSKSPCGVSTY